MRATPTTAPALQHSHSLRDRAGWIVRAYYWLAPAFVVLWLAFGIDVRFPFLDALPGSRAALYGLQMACTVTLAYRPALAPLVGSLESSLTIGLLIVSTWMAYWGMYLDVDAATAIVNPFTPESVRSLVISATILSLSRISRSVNPR